MEVSIHIRLSRKSSNAVNCKGVMLIVWGLETTDVEALPKEREREKR